MSTAAGSAPALRRRRRRWPIVLAVLLVLVVLVVIAAVVGDRIFRARAEAQIAQSVDQSLPDGVAGRVTADVHGFSALQQYAGGEFEHVTLHSHGLEVAGAPATGTVELYGLPVNGGRIAEATARLRVGQAAFHGLPALKKVNATDPTIGSGTVSTNVRQSILGLQITVAVTLTPSLRGQVVHLVPTNATLKAGPAAVPATAIIRQLLPDGVSVCAASYLPRGVELTSIAARPRTLEVALIAQNVDLDDLGSGRTGTCS